MNARRDDLPLSRRATPRRQRQPENRRRDALS